MHTLDDQFLIPVRLIPFVTGWDFPPDLLVRILADKDRLHHLYIPSMHLLPDGKAHPMLPKEWDVFITDIDILAKTLQAKEEIDNENYTLWRESAIHLLPSSTFVWLEDLKSAWNIVFSDDRKLESHEPEIIKSHECKGERELILQPFIPTNVREVVFEGFESLPSSTPPPLNSASSAIISSTDSPCDSSTVPSSFGSDGHEVENDTNSTDNGLSSAFDPLPLSGIAKIFPLTKDEQSNLAGWKIYAEQASRNELQKARVSVGKGRAESTFDPWLVADWLVKKGLYPRDKADRKLASNLPSRNAHLRDLILQ